MEALSPRSTNVQVRTKVQAKKEIADTEAKKLQKDKEFATPPPDWVFQPPQKNGVLAEKYRIGKILGKGGFAICYEGELRGKRHTTKFALKIVKAKMNQRKMEEKFRTELQIHAKMRHPNIVEFHRAFTFKESTYVVLELCSNGSVMDMVRKRRCLSLPEVRRLTIQLCGAVKYMHARNVIHRDLKMGNLFLDRDMNLKIGDFGLAAVLVSPDEFDGIFNGAVSRRTTLCGTPNYIAPEILEKGKRGHDHKVDIWAVGVILFAMIAGYPPFQASSQSEIYRKAREIDYTWPENRSCANDIPEEAKDLVGCLLKVDAEARPDLDRVVGHPFFSMHNGNSMPLILEDSCRYNKPDWLTSERPRGDVICKGTPLLELSIIAKQCGVGFLIGASEPYEVAGEDVEISLYKECVVEELAGTYPIVPLPADMVYTSKASQTDPLSVQAPLAASLITTTSRALVKAPLPVQQSAEKCIPAAILERPRRGPTQSHAATLRAAHVIPVSSHTVGRNVGIRSGVAHRVPRQTKLADTESATVRAPRGLLNEVHVRLNPTNGDLPVRTASRQTSRVTRSKKADSPPLPPDSPVNAAKLGSDRNIGIIYSEPAEIQWDMAARTKGRVAMAVQREMTEAVNSAKGASQGSLPVRPRQTSNGSSHGNVLIGPDEVPECLPYTKPDEVRSKLYNLHKELSRSLGNAGSNDPSIDVQKKNIKSRPVVIKWVDYTNKFGIGYILANGTVGCVFKGDKESPPTCVVVAGAEGHLKRRKIAAYTEKHQIVPQNGAPVEFFENCGEEGIKRVFKSPNNFQVRIDIHGMPEKLGPGADVHDFEKRRKLCLWDKFGKYMTQTLGKSDSDDPNALLTDGENPSISKRNVAGPFVKFYQRLGNVGIWGFGNGSFQFNFPDHTKLVISDDGSWLDFYHLPTQAAQVLKQGGVLEAGSLAERSVLCYPLATMLSGLYRGHDFRTLVRENELTAKITFIKEIMESWDQSGGLGCMGAKKGLKWDGMTEKGGKLVWVTVGAQGGDGRYEQPVAA